MAVIPMRANSLLPFQLNHHYHCSPNQHVQSYSGRTWSLLPQFASKPIVVGVTTLAAPVTPFVASSALDLSFWIFVLPFVILKIFKFEFKF